jgi:hypothetical protein
MHACKNLSDIMLKEQLLDMVLACGSDASCDNLKILAAQSLLLMQHAPHAPHAYTCPVGACCMQGGSRCAMLLCCRIALLRQHLSMIRVDVCTSTYGKAVVS